MSLKVYSREKSSPLTTTHGNMLIAHGIYLPQCKTKGAMEVKHRSQESLADQPYAF